MMEARTLELDIISAQGLKKVSTFGHDTCYAVAFIYSNEKRATKVDKKGGENPCWNAKLSFTCDEKLLRHGRSYITVKIYSYGSFNTTLVGTTLISLSDVGKQDVGQPQFMAYEVRRPSGKVRGVLNVCMNVGEKRTLNHSGQAYSAFSLADRTQKPQQEVPTSYLSSNGSASDVVAVYPPPRPNGDSSATSTSDSKKEEEPVLAYPASGVPGAYPPQYGQQYGPQYFGSGYEPQGYFDPAAQPFYGYQDQYQYSQPRRHRYGGSSSSSSTGFGILGAALGGLLLGEVVGSIF